MTATNPMSEVAQSSAQLRTDLGQAAEPGRNPARQRTSWLLTVFMLICVGYFLLPLFWLVVASTKSGKVHNIGCISAKRISAGARVEVKTTDGFELCRQCFR